MERIRSLTRFQKGILMVLAAIAVLFSVVYITAGQKEGYAYRDQILFRTEESGNTVYSGKISGQRAVFTVRGDKSIEYRYGDKTYGPYIVKEDPSALPDGAGSQMTGYEIRRGDELYFRGAVIRVDRTLLAFDENGDLESAASVVSEVNGVVMDEDGNIIDQNEPSFSELIKLAEGPELVHRGSWGFWFLGMFVSILTAVSVLYADELFRFYMGLRLANAENAEPSDLVLVMRRVSWVCLLAAVIFIFITGLNAL